jgi:predicted dehydrogenase
MSKVVIIGMGNIGKRHLQSVCGLDLREGIVGFDTDGAVLRSVPVFCEENGMDASGLTLVDNEEEMLSSITAGAVVIAATPARDRVALLEKVLSASPRAVIVEKPLCQSMREYEKIISLQDGCPTDVYVNFQKRTYPLYREIKERLDSRGTAFFHALAPGGLACGGIHSLDLMVWLLDFADYEIVHAACSRTFESKRRGFFDLEGEVVFVTDGGVLCSLRAVAGDGLVTNHLSSDKEEILINEIVGTLLVSRFPDFQEVRNVHIPYVSEITGKIVRAIIDGREPVGLPDVHQAFLAHRILFDYLAGTGNEGLNIT